MDRPRYNYSRIQSVESLSKYLGIKKSELILVSNNTSRYIKPNTPEIKSNGKIRQTYRIAPRLERIQKKIVKKIFHHVTYPRYLQGGIKDKKSPRDYMSDASIHARKRIVISEDVSNFFPSIHANEIDSLWLGFFKFSPEVATLLTKLTTLNEWLYQGASTSSYIANLMFWDIEPGITRTLESLGIEYTRYIDDVTVSSNDFINNALKTKIISTLYTMFRKKRLTPNRSKHYSSSSDRLITVHGLTVNSRQATLNKKERERIRSAVHHCCRVDPDNRFSDEYESFYNQTVGRVQTLRRLHKIEGDRLLEKLAEVSPT